MTNLKKYKRSREIRRLYVDFVITAKIRAWWGNIRRFYVDFLITATHRVDLFLEITTALTLVVERTKKDKQPHSASSKINCCRQHYRKRETLLHYYRRTTGLKKDLDNDYNGCVAKQASRAMGDVTKRINSGAAPRIGGHGWKFSLMGRN